MSLTSNIIIASLACFPSCVYWAVQEGLLTPLTFACHRFSPLAAFTSGAYFFTMEGGDSECANFTLPTLKAYLEARSHNVSGNKQYLCYKIPQNAFSPLTRDLLVSKKKKKTQRRFSPTLHPFSPVTFATSQF